MEKLVEYLIGGGVHGLFVLGSSGEGASLDAAERAAVVRTVTGAARGRVPVLVGVIDTSSRRIVEYAEMAREFRADAVVAPPTFYFVSNQPEILHFFRTVAKNSALPVVAYNLPQIVKVPLEPATVTQLAREGTIRGIKDSSPDFAATREMLVQTAAVPGFPVLTGHESMVDVGVAMGMAGAVPGLANVAPGPYVDIYECARRGEAAQARALQEKMMALAAIKYHGRSGQSHSAGALSGYKAALKMLGVIATNRMHEPMQGLTEKEEEGVRQVMRETGLL
jgi:4-hydroxy-tetrahydrodipicolinate synthase